MVKGIRALTINGVPVLHLTYGSSTEGVKDKDKEEEEECIFIFQF
jgi:hypothetical protein